MVKEGPKYNTVFNLRLALTLFIGFEGMWPGTCDWVFVPKGDIVQIKRKTTAEKKTLKSY